MYIDLGVQLREASTEKSSQVSHSCSSIINNPGGQEVRKRGGTKVCQLFPQAMWSPAKCLISPNAHTSLPMLTNYFGYWLNRTGLMLCQFLLYSCYSLACVCVCVYTHVLFFILFHYGLSQDTEHSPLCYTVGPCCLPILYITAVSANPNLPSHPSLHLPTPWLSRICSLCLWFCFRFIDRFIWVLFRMLSCFSCVWLHADCSPPDSSVRGIL